MAVLAEDTVQAGVNGESTVGLTGSTGRPCRDPPGSAAGERPE